LYSSIKGTFYTTYFKYRKFICLYLSDQTLHIDTVSTYEGNDSAHCDKCKPSNNPLRLYLIHLRYVQRLNVCHHAQPSRDSPAIKCAVRTTFPIIFAEVTNQKRTLLPQVSPRDGDARFPLTCSGCLSKVGAHVSAENKGGGDS